ncbi:SIS domain-containing protein [candidate division KSB1 bacterium]|nr:SIS domain-containing protein [candidate division KSB1 bacterium]
MTEQIFGISVTDLAAYSSQFTAKEINQQPKLWAKTYQQLLLQKNEVAAFLQKLFVRPKLDIIFSGAGTSAFIGNSLSGLFQKNTGLCARAVATTDIVTHPQYYFSKDIPTLLISFARSGDSPESLAVIHLANDFCDEIYHLIITCNAQGKLATNAHHANSLVIVLPPETNDQGLAMTGSFSSMLLMAILISKISQLTALEKSIATLCQYAQKIIDGYAVQLRQVCDLLFNRAVFLGSGALKGCAEECHLKLQELTDGYVVSQFDSFLGFRHGPKAVINAKTLLVYFLSNDPYVFQYERDLIHAVNIGERGLYRIAVLEHDQPDIDVNLKIVLNTNKDSAIDPDFLPVCNVLIGQLLGFFRSLALGLKPDAPSASGTITRVVQGVQIYPLQQAQQST